MTKTLPPIASSIEMLAGLATSATDAQVPAFDIHRSPDGYRELDLPLKPEPLSHVRMCELEEVRIAAEVNNTLRNEPMLTFSDGTWANRIKPTKTLLEECIAGNATFTRLAAIHRILSGTKGPEAAIATDNGANSLAHTAFALSALGTFVEVREPHEKAAIAHLASVAELFPDELQRMISYDDRADFRGEPYADIAYWSGPPPRFFKDRTPSEIIDYMGMSLLESGFLVIQSDLPEFNIVPYAESQWKMIFSALMCAEDGTDGVVLPTRWFKTPTHLMIYRKIPGSCPRGCCK